MVLSLYLSSLWLSVDLTTSGALSLGRSALSMSRSSLARPIPCKPKEPLNISNLELPLQSRKTPNTSRKTLPERSKVIAHNRISQNNSVFLVRGDRQRRLYCDVARVSWLNAQQTAERETTEKKVSSPKLIRRQANLPKSHATQTFCLIPHHTLKIELL